MRWLGRRTGCPRRLAAPPLANDGEGHFDRVGDRGMYHALGTGVDSPAPFCKRTGLRACPGMHRRSKLRSRALRTGWRSARGASRATRPLSAWPGGSAWAAVSPWAGGGLCCGAAWPGRAALRPSRSASWHHGRRRGNWTPGLLIICERRSPGSNLCQESCNTGAGQTLRRVLPQACIVHLPDQNAPHHCNRRVATGQGGVLR
mmetsp:Transcript_13171/g.50420  ORF Transcript_13171/g.50420 Transcript_13171/m.50420 type:complete len:203 (+) Transcript_13171:633-1241(+)